MRERFIATINDAIDNNKELVVSLESGTNAISVNIIPHAMDDGEKEIIVYSDKGILTIDTKNIQYVSELDEFVCVNNTSIVTISR